MYPIPMECEPLAQAPLTVKLIPFNLRITPRFMVIVEFIDWNIDPEPIIMVFFFLRNVSAASITAVAELSLP